MLRALTSTLLLLLITQPLPAQQEPPEDLFNYSSRDLAFRVPPEFQLVAQNRKYLNPAAHEVPRFQRIWQHGSDGIIVSVVIWRDAAWQKTPKETFDQVLANMLSDPTLKLVSRRSYELDGCPAESITCYYQSANGTSQRMDSFLAKPYVFMLAYVSSKPSSWDDSVSKAFFQTISLKPKKRTSNRPKQSLQRTAGPPRMTRSQHVYEVRPRQDKRGFDLISDVLPFGRLWYGEPNAVSNAIGYAKFRSRSHDAVIRVYDECAEKL